jgi:hypothetical protein
MELSKDVEAFCLLPMIDKPARGLYDMILAIARIYTLDGAWNIPGKKPMTHPIIAAGAIWIPGQSSISKNHWQIDRTHPS